MNPHPFPRAPGLLALVGAALASPAAASDGPTVAFDNPIISLARGARLELPAPAKLQVHTYLVHGPRVLGGKTAATRRLAEGSHPLAYTTEGGFQVASGVSKKGVMPGDNVTITVADPDKPPSIEPSTPFAKQWPLLAGQWDLPDGPALVVYATNGRGPATPTLVQVTSEASPPALCRALALCE